ncbi:MAG: hypothetical protein KDD94_02760 [Calditrichaeota bacterium]|nr:hypothetical protein [Calditrichota bacterium]
MKKFYLVLLFIVSCSNTSDDKSPSTSQPDAGPIVKTLVANLATAESLTLLPDGNLVTPYNPGAVLEIKTDGSSASYASGFGANYGGGVDALGRYYVSDWGAGQVIRINADNSKTIIASINQPVGVIFDADNNMYVNSFQDNAVYKVTPIGATSQFAFNPDGAEQLFNGPDGIVLVNDTFYTINYYDSKIVKISAGGSASLFATLPGSTTGYLTYAKGALYAASISTNKIYKISLSGDVSVFAGTGNTGTADGKVKSASFAAPNGIVASTTGDTLFVSDHQNPGTPQRTSSIRMIIFD